MYPEESLHNGVGTEADAFTTVMFLGDMVVTGSIVVDTVVTDVVLVGIVGVGPGPKYPVDPPEYGLLT